MPRVAVPLAAAAVVLLLLIARSPAHAFQQNVYLSLPWEGGATWRYSTGPHGPSGIPEALDLQPPDAAGKPCELFTSSFWVVASAPGLTILPDAAHPDQRLREAALTRPRCARPASPRGRGDAE